MVESNLAQGVHRMKPDSIPVMIDDYKQTDRIKMTRCNYFSIEGDLPSPGWTISLQDRDIPFFLIGLSGIIVKPLSDERFGSPSSIEELFSAIEDNPSLFVDINEVWLPNFLFDHAAQRGALYRIDHRLFSLALQFQNQQITLEKFLGEAREHRAGVELSAEETEAFRGWEANIVGDAKKTYPKNPELALRWKNTDFEVEP